MATEVKGLAGAGICAEDSDPAGWGTFVGFGFVYEGLSFLRDVRRVPPASITVYDPRRERASGRPPGGGPRGAPRPRSTPSRRTRSPRRSCVRSTPTASTYPGQGTLLMSGGFESRFVLCALTRAGAAAQALILSNVAIEPDDADGRSRRAARALGIAPASIASNPGFYASPAYLDYLLASEVSAPSIGLFIAQLGVHVRPEFGAVWEGAAPGNSLKTSHQPRSGLEVYLREAANPLGSERSQAAARVFAPPLFRAMEEGFRGGAGGRALSLRRRRLRPRRVRRPEPHAEPHRAQPPHGLC